MKPSPKLTINRYHSVHAYTSLTASRISPTTPSCTQRSWSGTFPAREAYTHSLSGPHVACMANQIADDNKGYNVHIRGPEHLCSNALVYPSSLSTGSCSRVIKSPTEIEILRYTNEISSMAHLEVGRCLLTITSQLDIHCFLSAWAGDACREARHEGVRNGKPLFTCVLLTWRNAPCFLHLYLWKVSARTMYVCMYVCTMCICMCVCM